MKVLEIFEEIVMKFTEKRGGVKMDSSFSLLIGSLDTPLCGPLSVVIKDFCLEDENYETLCANLGDYIQKDMSNFSKLDKSVRNDILNLKLLV